MHCQYCGKPILTYREAQTHTKECNMKVPQKSTGSGTDGYGKPFAKDTPPPPPHPAGTANAVIVDYIDLGMVEQDVYGKPGTKESVHLCKYVIQSAKTMPDGRRYLLAFKPFGVRVSLHEKAALRGFLESIDGRNFTVDEDVDFEGYVGRPCVVIVTHKASADGTKTYANIDSAGPHMEGLPVLAPKDYVRVKDREAAGNGAQAAAESGGFEEATQTDTIPF